MRQKKRAGGARDSGLGAAQGLGSLETSFWSRQGGGRTGSLRAYSLQAAATPARRRVQEAGCWGERCLGVRATHLVVQHEEQACNAPPVPTASSPGTHPSPEWWVSGATVQG